MTSYDLFHVLASMQKDESVCFYTGETKVLQMLVRKDDASVGQSVEDRLIDKVNDKPAYFAMQIADMLGHLRRGEGGTEVGT